MSEFILGKLKNLIPSSVDTGILVLRLFIGSRLLYGVIDNIISWEKMVEFSVFLQNFNFPLPITSALVSVSFQFLAAISILLGLQIRFFAMVMVVNFLIAILFVHLPLEESVEGMTPALAMLFSCLTFFFTGARKFSLDSFFGDNKHT